MTPRREPPPMLNALHGRLEPMPHPPRELGPEGYGCDVMPAQVPPAAAWRYNLVNLRNLMR